MSVRIAEVDRKGSKIVLCENRASSSLFTLTVSLQMLKNSTTNKTLKYKKPLKMKKTFTNPKIHQNSEKP
jgi:hypothetical protein